MNIIQWVILILFGILGARLLMAAEGLEVMQPLVAYAVIYLVLLTFLRVYLWPAYLEMRKNSPMPALMAATRLFVLRLALYGLLVLGAFWALSILGLADTVFNGLFGLPGLPIPFTTYVLPAWGLLIIISLLLIGMPVAFRRVRK